ncbi:MAG TPA: UvrD-helicase domain-containing protein [Candidatus Omnitrophota bacterium]|nr:UvrD-helicase domain-containing protein [Candidatus Omnitrophota bacterium]
MAEARKTGAIEYSPKQKAAVEAWGKNVCVSSGAGSGKTSVLVGRFLYLVTEKRISPDAIVAITYTEKAANQMKERLVRAFLGRGMTEERRQLEGAYIGTIHSFAARLLKENPAEARVDPYFTVIEEGQANLLMDEVLESLLEETGGDPEGFELLRRYEEDPVRAGLKKIHSKIRSFDGTAETWMTRGIPGEELLWGEAERMLRKFLDAKGQRESKTYRENLDAARELSGLSPEIKAGASWESIAVLDDIAKRFKKNGALKESVGEIRDWLEEILLVKAERTGARVRKAFLELYEKFSAGYEAKKLQNAFLDFDDLLAKASLLFSRGDERSVAVRDRYRRKFSHILVDEFQDTSRLQAKWIDALARPGGLFVIGDGKQSIYRFRNADLESFREREEIMKNDPGALHIGLAENYRSRDLILEFANRLFEELWREDGFEFEPLSAKRSFGEKKAPSVEFLCVEQKGEDKDETKAQARVREARILAARIREMVETGEIRITRRDGTVRNVRYGDIAILFQAMTHSNLYENELREREIPYFVVRGRGFYEKQEIADLVDFLSILDDPRKDVELAAVLRSPLVGISEDGLFWLSRVKAGGAGREDEDLDDEEETGPRKTPPLSECFLREDLAERLSEEDRLNFRRFLAFYSELYRERDRLALSEILERLISKTAYDSKLLGTWMGKQKIVNIRKLVEIARQFEANRAFSLRDFVAYVTELRLQDPRESEAQVELERGDSVKLLTIHKAKGLEFPVVILADLGRERGGFEQGRFNFSEKFGIGFKFRNDLTGKWQDGFLFQRNREWEKQRDREEQKRLFYVAVTRAEEHLILSGTSEMGTIKEGKSYHDLPDWMQWLRKAFRYEEFRNERQLKFCGVPINILSPEGVSTEKRTLRSRIEREPFKRAYDTLTAIPQKEQEKPGPEVEAMTREIARAGTSFRKDYYETLDLPVTAMLAFDECPGCYFDRYEMRMPEDIPEGDDARELFPGDEEPVLAGRDFGDLFHRVMENFDFSKPYAEELARHLAEHREALSGKDFERLEKGLRGFFSGEPGRRMREFEVFRELPFIYKLPRGKLSGKIDLLAKTPEGRWILIDYKTDRIRDGKDLEARMRHHEPQIILYALALHDISGVMPAEGILYFASAGRCVSFPIDAGRIQEARKKVSANLETIISKDRPFLHREGCPRHSFAPEESGEGE